ncbi:MAG: DUF3108 domain-containing protein [Syntrophobacteraceae bacterium]
MLLLIALASGESGGVCQDPGEVPFRTGERLTFELKWEFIKAGTAVLEVLPMTEVNGIPARHFLLTVKSSSFVDTFYMVRDTIEAFTDGGVTRSLLYKKRQQEGKHRRDIVVNFDWQKEEALYTNFGKPARPVKVLPGTFDPFSIFYAFRMCNLKENIQLDASVSDGKKCVVGKAKVLKRQFIRVNDHSYDTFLVEPDLKDVGGVFKKSKDAKLQIWVSNDSRKLPVRIASSVVVGEFIAELVSVDHVPAP